MNNAELLQISINEDNLYSSYKKFLGRHPEAENNISIQDYMRLREESVSILRKEHLAQLQSKLRDYFYMAKSIGEEVVDYLGSLLKISLCCTSGGLCFILLYNMALRDDNPQPDVRPSITRDYEALEKAHALRKSKNPTKSENNVFNK